MMMDAPVLRLTVSDAEPNPDENLGNGTGTALSIPILVLAGICTLVTTFFSFGSIHLHLKNYRKPLLQRMVVRIIVMVPLYAISSLISLFSLSAAFFIDAVRDIYEAFVIYCFFDLLLQYLGGERQFLISMQGRPPKKALFPVNLWKRELDISDPHTFLFIKRGIFQYAQVKPVLAVVTMILKATNKFNDGDLKANSGYLYVSIVYNASITLSLYCLAVFWMCINTDVKSFRPVPKFLCIKGILFFSFWQNLLISILVATNILTRLGPYTDPERISTALTDLLICIEMPFFAIAHQYAFSYRDFVSASTYSYVARMPMYNAFKDAFGILDIIVDTKATFGRDHGMHYKEYETRAVGPMHVGEGRERRIKAGLRYVRGGKGKYWLGDPTSTPDDTGPSTSTSAVSPTTHLAAETPYTLPFEAPEASFDDDDQLYAQSKKYLFGDYNYPSIDVSSEGARIRMWDEEERVLRDERGAWFSDIRGAKGRVYLGERRKEGFGWSGYGAVGTGAGAGSSAIPAIETVDPGEERFIDHEDLRVPQLREPNRTGSDVKLSWTHHPHPHPHSPHSGVSSVPTQNPHSFSPTIQPSSTNRHERPRSRKISDDAVDLVVAAEASRSSMEDGWRTLSAQGGRSVQPPPKEGSREWDDNPWA